MLDLSAPSTLRHGRRREVLFDGETFSPRRMRICAPSAGPGSRVFQEPERADPVRPGAQVAERPGARPEVDARQLPAVPMTCRASRDR